MQVYVKHVNSRRSHFVAQGHNLNKFGKSSLDDATNVINIMALGLVVSDKESFCVFRI